MKILILTQYYPPEIGAPQNRLHELALRLVKSGLNIEVLTALPNYPSNVIHEPYLNGKNREEIIDGIRVHRSWIYVSKSKSIRSRLLNYFSFVASSYFLGRKLGAYDFLLVESPPLFLGYSAMALSRRLKAKLIFNVSDLWPESAEKLGIVSNKMLLNFAYNLERKCYKRATLVTGQTQGIVYNISERFPKTNVYWLPNGVDVSLYDPQSVHASAFRQQNGFSESDLLIFYGGILGHAQGLEVVLKAAKLLESQTQVHFIIQGTGPMGADLIQLKADLGLTQVHFLEPVPKSKMPGILKAMDLAVVPLRKLDLFQGAIPSKVFEALSMQVPILLGVDGEARTHFVDRAKAAWFFEPENPQALADKVTYLIEHPEEIKQAGINGRKYVHTHFNRDHIAHHFIEKLHKIDLIG